MAIGPGCGPGLLLRLQSQGLRAVVGLGSGVGGGVRSPPRSPGGQGEDGSAALAGSGGQQAAGATSAAFSRSFSCCAAIILCCSARRSCLRFSIRASSCDRNKGHGITLSMVYGDRRCGAQHLRLLALEPLLISLGGLLGRLGLGEHRRDAHDTAAGHGADKFFFRRFKVPPWPEDGVSVIPAPCQYPSSPRFCSTTMPGVVDRGHLVESSKNSGPVVDELLATRRVSIRTVQPSSRALRRLPLFALRFAWASA